MLHLGFLNRAKQYYLPICSLFCPRILKHLVFIIMLANLLESKGSLGTPSMYEESTLSSQVVVQSIQQISEWGQKLIISIVSNYSSKCKRYFISKSYQRAVTASAHHHLYHMQRQTSYYFRYIYRSSVLVLFNFPKINVQFC